ncbi:helix-turn-helix domain-containing protein [Streptomyces sp. NBC_00237]|uniref:helix-turn-helix domain-containing protein n=1 Tax=Streptomyces sp. NBC_00237 TaxID=2975687 RepID=UPI0022540BF3|nr:helix-turn-helix domain-containing protein [Streptomyces sp. NBC_00237]MCX5202450.1 helix-turn-helix domain-containing protein [Streptomyces sp. NBC_00237]
MEAAENPTAAAERPPYRVKEVARILGVSLATVYEEIATGRLPALAIGEGSGAKRVEHADLVAYKQRCRIRAIRSNSSTQEVA